MMQRSNRAPDEWNAARGQYLCGQRVVGAAEGRCQRMQLRSDDKSTRGCGDGCINRASRYQCAAESYPCGERCSNRQLQVGSTITTAVVDCGRRGVGVILLEPVDTGRYIGEYVGEVITCREAHERALKYHHEKHSYMLQVCASEVIDATRIGSQMRFVNHGCGPNCLVEKWCVRGRERCGLFAARQIRAGDELTFDYQLHCFSIRTIECL
ncbi:hypothetical protein PF005_g23592 [Phytophthora fragariae]|uniref:SET domain-containing protein n=1 Tax=Phytophthora fragariae TaxID=53985 RepID=A0A6A3W6F8_9STRA|nr:hypothetical protein PF005_g23592 [Phytophthora fragariae]